MFSVCLASFVFIMTSSFSGMPISGTHTVVGALLGTGLSAAGASTLNWTKLGMIVISWVLSPFLAGVLAFLQMILVSKFTMNSTQYTFRTRLAAMQVIVASSFVVITYVILSLLGFEANGKSYEFVIITLLAILIGVVIFRLLLTSILLRNSHVELERCQIVSYVVIAVCLPLSFNFIEQLTL